MSKLVITLIHGTWATGAAWTRSESELAKRLALLNGGNTAILHFDWSGRNTFRARHSASKLLAEHVRAATAAHPGCKHYLVAHSHGGNVALQACRDPEVSDKVSGVVCLSTPFLLVRPRSFRTLGRHYSLGMFAVAGFSSYLAFLFRLLTPTASIWLAVGSVWFAIVAIWLLLTPKLQRLSEKLAASVSPEGLPPSKLLVLRAIGDEAMGVLSGLQFAGWLVWAFWRGVEACCRTMANLANRILVTDYPQSARTTKERAAGAALFGVMFFVFGLAGISGALNSGSPGAGVGVLLVFLGLMILPLLYMLLKEPVVAALNVAPQFVLTAVAPVLAIPLIPFGPEAAVFGILTEVIPEVCPVGTNTVVQIDGRSTSAGLRHSEAYAHPDAIEVTARWIEMGNA